MLLRGRGASSAPATTVERLSETAHVPIPGDDDARHNRISSLGALTGIAAGAGMGATLGLALGCGWRPPTAVLTATATVGALIGTNGPMTVLRVTDPRTWSTTDWISDVLPHLAYGAVTAATYGARP